MDWGISELPVEALGKIKNLILEDKQEFRRPRSQTI